MLKQLSKEQAALKAQWEREQKVKCYICDVPVLIEDNTVCQICNKTVCGDHSTIMGGLKPDDDWYVICKNCFERR